MSIAATRAVRARSDARGTARLVLLEFADHATNDGRSWASAPTIARGCRCSERTARRLIAELVAAGELVPVGRKLGKYRGAIEYQIAACLDGATPDNVVWGGAPTTPDNLSGVEDPLATNPCQNRYATPDKTGSGPLTGLSPNPLENPIGNPRKAAAAAQQAVAIFNQLAEELGLVRVQRLTAKRRALLEARLAECGGPEGWTAVLARIRGSPGLSKHNGRGWKLDFDWVLDETNFAKLAEGRYDGWDPAARDRAGRGQSPGEKLVAGFAAAADRAARRGS